MLGFSKSEHGGVLFKFERRTLDGVSWSDVQLVPSPPLLSSSGDADDGESGGGESSLRFRPCTGAPPPIFIPPDAGPYNNPNNRLTSGEEFPAEQWHRKHTIG